MIWLILIGSLLAVLPAANAQEQQPLTAINGNCRVYFNLSVASSGAQATPWLPTQNQPPAGSAGTSLVIDNRQAGCYGWTVESHNHGFSALSLSFQSAPDNTGGTAPGTWSTVAVCGGTECLGVNPIVSTTDTVTTTKTPGAWLRVNLTSKTGTGSVSGVLYGWKVNIVANGGGPVPPPPTPVSPGGTPTQIQYNLDGTLFGGIPGSQVRTDGAVDLLSTLNSPYGGYGLIQNLLVSSDCFDSCQPGTNWTTTNITINDVQLTAPTGQIVADNDLTSTVNGAFISQLFDTTQAMTGRTFTFSVWLKVPTTPVTSLLAIVSNTPTTCGTQTAAVTTAWKRFFVTCTFGADAGTQVGIHLAPVNGGQGLVYAWGTQLQESATLGPYCATSELPIIGGATGVFDIAYGECHSMGFSGLSGATVSGLSFGDSNDLTFHREIAIGFNNSLGDRSMAMGEYLAPSGFQTKLFGEGQDATHQCADANGGEIGFCFGGQAPTVQLNDSAVGTTGVLFVNLGTPTNGTRKYCSDCTVTSGIDNTCAATGPGGFAYRINGAWKCII